MSALLDLQERFGAGLTAAPGTRVPSVPFAGTEDRIRAGWDVYRANIDGNCAAALASAYPVVRKIVGEGFFGQMARDFSRVRASRSGDLNRYGESFATFIAGYRDVDDLPYLRDVARLEWRAHVAHFAADPAPFDHATLAATAPEQYASLLPRLAPACALLSSRWPIGRIWVVHQDDHDGPPDVDLRSGPERVLVHRPRWRAAVQVLSEGEFRFLGAAWRGAALGAAIDAAVAAEPGFDPASHLSNWIHTHVIDRLL